MLALLGSYGLQERTIAALGLGMREPYRRVDGETVSGVIVYPVTGAGGRTRYGCISLPGATENPEHSIGWSCGSAEAVAYGSGDIALVCASALEAWVAWQAAEAAGIAVTSMASTQPDIMPASWSKARYWSGWMRVIVTDCVPRGVANALSVASARPLEGCPAAPVPSDANAVEAEELTDWIGLVADGERQLAPSRATGDVLTPGNFEASRVSVHGGMQGGRMYYAFAVERRERSQSGGGFLFSYRTLVLRSDGAVLEPGLLPAPPGTPADLRVHALSDGTRIAPALATPSGGSWSLAGIKRFAARTQAGAPYDGPAGLQLISELTRHLESVVWLPDTVSYGRVAAFIMATYFHRLFDAFPLLFVTGPKGTGKSELTSAIVSLAFNGALMSQGSSAALVRLARETGGLIAIDDAEMLTAGFGELAQVLKTGYKASTAIKRVVGPSGMVEAVDYYGPRVLCNTRGLDDVLLSRCLVVGTARMPDGERIGDRTATDPAELRDRLHDFAMSHISDMTAVIADCSGSATGRDGEVALPLRAVARLTELLSI